MISFGQGNVQFFHLILLSLFVLLLTLIFHEQYSSPRTLELSKSESMQRYSSLSDDEKQQLFDSFMDDYQKNYSDNVEKQLKYSNFLSNLKRIDDLNLDEFLLGSSGRFGITKFSDFSESDLKELPFTGYINKSIVAPFSMSRPARLKDYSDEEFLLSIGAQIAGSSSDDDDDDETISWVGTYTSGVHNQGYCGSCWAWSAVEQIESDAIRHGLLSLGDTLSVQQIISCDTVADGCDGGSTEEAYFYVHKLAGGLETSSSYPYSSYWGKSGTCSSSSEDYTISIKRFYVLESEEAMETHVASVGPISVCVDASSWYFYVRGVISSCGTTVNHCVQAVGLNREDSDEPYWILRNSWGSLWGRSGYIYLKAGEDTCGITYDATFTTPYSLSDDDDNDDYDDISYYYLYSYSSSTNSNNTDDT